MGGRGVLLVNLLIVLACSVSGVNGGNATLSATTYYEGMEAAFVLAISNTDSNPISDIVLSVPNDYDVNDESVTEPDNFVLTITNDLSWSAASGGVDDAVQYFRFTATPALVSEDTTYIWDVELTDEIDDSGIISIPIILRNDATAPVLSNYYPEGYIREGVSDETVSVDAVDNETGIKDGIFEYGYCSGW